MLGCYVAIGFVHAAKKMVHFSPNQPLRFATKGDNCKDGDVDQADNRAKDLKCEEAVFNRTVDILATEFCSDHKFLRTVGSTGGRLHVGNFDKFLF